MAARSGGRGRREAAVSHPSLAGPACDRRPRLGNDDREPWRLECKGEARTRMATGLRQLAGWLPPQPGGEPAESPGQRFPALVWKILLLHGAQPLLAQNAAIAGDAPGTLSRLGTERIQ